MYLPFIFSAVPCYPHSGPLTSSPCHQILPLICIQKEIRLCHLDSGVFEAWIIRLYGLYINDDMV